MTRGGDRGALAIVLHTHMPYVEGFGTWPFGEEWLWEAMAGSYLPLLDLLDSGAPLTLSLTPVLCDQLEAAGIAERFGTFVSEVRAASHAQDSAGLRAGGYEDLARELDRSWGDYTRALESFERRGGDILAAFAAHVQWTSSATHAVLPLLASDAGVQMQVHTGVEAHRRRFGEGWRGGFWLPECAYAPWLDRALEGAGVSAVCVELTNLLGLGAAGHLQPILTEEGILLVPVDRSTMSLVWSDQGYPASGAYRDYHHHTVHHHNPWNNRGDAYNHEEATALAREHAGDFVARVLARLAQAGVAGGGLLVCALDTELLGHWWYEGVDWLSAVVEECSRQGLELVRLDEALEGRQATAIGDLPAKGDWPASSWGLRGDLSTWSAPAVAEMAFATRAAELEVLLAGERVSSAAVREMLALQASDWAFMSSRGMAVPYAQERFEGHLQGLRRALTEGPQADRDSLRNLAIDAGRATFQAG